MNDDVGAKLAMSGRVLGFYERYPSDQPGQQRLVEKLRGLYQQAGECRLRQDLGHNAASAGRIARLRTRQEIHAHLGTIVRIARAAVYEEPELARRFRLPYHQANHLEYLASATVIHSEAARFREIFLRYGLPADFLEVLGGAIERCEDEWSRQHSGIRLHVGATATLEAIAADMMKVVNALDAMARVRFDGHAGILAAWRSARHIVRRRGRGSSSTAESGDEQAG